MLGISLLLSFPQPVSFPPFLQVKPFDLIQQAQLDALATFMTYQNYVFYVAEIVAFSLALAAALRTPVNNIEYFPPNFEGLVLGCIDADFCK